MNIPVQWEECHGPMAIPFTDGLLNTQWDPILDENSIIMDEAV